MKVKSAVKRGFSFGLTSGIITTLGVIIGLFSSTNSRIIVVGGILIVAIADAFSDSLGIHISEESANKKHKEVWSATSATFLSKLVFALSFLIPILLFDFVTAIAVSVIWGLVLISLLSFYIAKEHKTNPLKVIGEHVLITLVVIASTFYVGQLIGVVFS